MLHNVVAMRAMMRQPTNCHTLPVNIEVTKFITSQYFPQDKNVISYCFTFPCSYSEPVLSWLLTVSDFIDNMGSFGDTTLGVPMYDIVLPIISWVVITVYYVFQFHRRAHTKNMSIHEDAVAHPGFQYYPTYFYQMRGGWVRKNFLTGQASANSTRDYLRVLLFFAGNSAVISMLFIGTAASFYDALESESRKNYFALKLAATAFVFLVTFYLFIYSLRYGTQFQ